MPPPAFETLFGAPPAQAAGPAGSPGGPDGQPETAAALLHAAGGSGGPATGAEPRLGGALAAWTPFFGPAGSGEAARPAGTAPGSGRPYYDLAEDALRKLGFFDWGWFGRDPDAAETGGGFADWSWFDDRPGAPEGGANGGLGDWQWFGPNDPPPPPAPPEFIPDIQGYTGAGQTIVVIDDGYSDLYDQSNTVAEFDFFDDDPDAEVTKLDSHGSWVAQTAITAASQAGIVHLKAFPNAGAVGSTGAVEEALQWVIDNGETFNVAAVNISLGAGFAEEESETALSDEFAEIADLGILNIVAAGNSGFFVPDSVNILAADPSAIAVAATDAGDRFAGFSQRSETLTDIAAPGVDIPTVTRDGLVQEVDGTSFAAPLVSGIAALLQEAAEAVNGERLAEDEFLEILRLSGRDVVGAPNDVPGYRVADPVAAVDFFLANAADYDDPGGAPVDAFDFA
jgi:hypothetical protein